MQGGGLLKRPAVNLQTANQSGNGMGQEASNFTAQLYLVIAVKISVYILLYVMTCFLFYTPHNPNNLDFQILISVSTQEVVEKKDINATLRADSGAGSTLLAFKRTLYR